MTLRLAYGLDRWGSEAVSDASAMALGRSVEEDVGEEGTKTEGCQYH